MSPAFYVVGILGLALLMVVHESGHYFAARRFGMRVTRFSIGFGPRLFKHQSTGSDTVFQIALIPFIAYVQIDGMNPFEESDPNDKGSYQNASLWARVCTIAAGPLANYFFASVLFFLTYAAFGRKVADESSMRVVVDSGGPAAVAEVRDGDKIVSVDHQNVSTWDQLKDAVKAHAGKPMDVEVLRGAESVHLVVTPYGADASEDKVGRIMIRPPTHAAGLFEAAKLAVIEPPAVVAVSVVGLVRIITLQEKPQPAGPVGLARMAAESAKNGAGELLAFLGMLSAYLGFFNMLPIPALDGGRLLFLGFEAASRRKPDAKVEAQIHAVALLMMLTLIAFVTYSDITSKH